MLIERDTESEELADALSAAADGTGGMVLVTGPVGSGKTEFLSAFAGHAVRAGAVAVRATGSAAERNVPLAVIHQLTSDIPSDKAAAIGLRRLLSTARDGVHDLTFSRTGAITPPAANLFIDVWEHILRLADQTPLVIQVDDVQHIDDASLHCLLFCARRLSSARVLLVLADSGQSRQLSTMLQAEAAHLPNYRSLRLAPLTPRGTARVLSRHLGVPAPPRLVAACHALTGGNVSLVRAIAADCANARGRPADEPVIGAAFRSTVHANVRRCGDATVQVAALLAVLGGLATRRLLTKALAADPMAIAQDLDTLEAMGLTEGERIRRPAVGAAVLESFSAETRAGLHRQAAVLLHDVGGPATVIADHLLAAGSIDASWAGGILEEAADAALDAGDHHRAIEFLRLAAQRHGAGGRQYEIIAKVMLIERQHDPRSAIRHLPTLVDAHRLGRLGDRTALELVDALTWDGQYASASKILRQMTAPGTRHDPETVSWLHVTRYRARHTFPVLRQSLREVQETDVRHVSTAERAAAALTRVLARDNEAEAADQAELILTMPPVADYTTSAIKMAVVALVYAGRIKKARQWCDRYLREWAASAPAAWRGALSAIRADIALREGDLGAASKHARKALDLVDFDTWGVGLPDPLGKLILAATWSGDLQTATHLISRPVRQEAFQTRFGLVYVHAQVHYNLALRQPEVALRKALACGRLMQDWDLDHSSLVPWRTDAAEAYLQLGELDRAKELAQEQLRRAGATDARSRAIALRVVASTIEPSSRLPLLTRAADLLRACGDRLELARVLADRGIARWALHEADRGTADLADARRLALECGAMPLVSALDPLVEKENAVEETPVVSPGVSLLAPRRDARASRKNLESLTKAELRVVELAAARHSNREISRKLRITVSTVEQHLTNAFRKLGVRRRTDLWTFFHVDALRKPPGDHGSASGNAV
ncbi:Transcriptional regulatory protein LiaR [Actinomadura rubteroloni]|uniref:Transcriptional regulatory protein LiaR n=1 Tax=Actinomadura rubteroloni TaxID=1926885 RepID=A0A2P4UCT7_9ACTN|nr:LuxR family transcriptional regulator [Actinomadura rubteroloni]POM22842.1 Transcriptional regulatory protein LiaR [Actinomadura rubteroloni]